jgi:hypothetical protein
MDAEIRDPCPPQGGLPSAADVSGLVRVPGAGEDEGGADAAAGPEELGHGVVEGHDADVAVLRLAERDGTGLEVDVPPLVKMSSTTAQRCSDSQIRQASISRTSSELSPASSR